MLWYLFMIIYHISEHLGKFIFSSTNVRRSVPDVQSKKITNDVINDEFVTWKLVCTWELVTHVCAYCFLSNQ